MIQITFQHPTPHDRLVITRDVQGIWGVGFQEKAYLHINHTLLYSVYSLEVSVPIRRNNTLTLLKHID